MKCLSAPLAILAALVPALPAAAIARPALVAANPAADATVARPTALRLDFDQPLRASDSTVDLVMTSMPGMANMPLMRMGVKTSVSPDGKSLLVALKAPAPAGTYTLSWTAIGTDGSKAAGSHGFTVE